MKLYAHRECPFCRRVRIALAEMKVECEYVELHTNADHPPELHGKTPMRTGVPILRVRDDLVLYDSAAIIYWLDSAYPNSVMPSARDPQAIARSLVGWAASKLYAPLKDFQTGSPEAKSKAADAILHALEGLDSVMPDEGWLVGSEFSIADMAAAPALVVLPKSLSSRTSPRMQAYIERLRQIPSVRTVCELDSVEARKSHAA
ncbi:MAG: glutathione S-transferase family protein [Polyangiales bacterium]